MAFAIRMVKLKNYLNEQKHEYNIADQIQRSGTAIGANHREAIAAGCIGLNSSRRQII